MARILTAQFVCENCGATATTTGDAPADWSTRLPSPTDSALAMNYSSTPGFGFAQSPDYCAECIQAARDAIRNALAQRKEQARRPH